jgi:hypothetical protein
VGLTAQPGDITIVAACRIGCGVLVALIIFIAQNTRGAVSGPPGQVSRWSRPAGGREEAAP